MGTVAQGNKTNRKLLSGVRSFLIRESVSSVFGLGNSRPVKTRPSPHSISSRHSFVYIRPLFCEDARARQLKKKNYGCRVMQIYTEEF
jgi:hypothetical protein